MTREMGVRFAAEGVRINAVAPGLVYSPLTENVVGDLEVNAEMRRLHPMGRIGGTEEIAASGSFSGFKRRRKRYGEHRAG